MSTQKKLNRWLISRKRCIQIAGKGKNKPVFQSYSVSKTNIATAIERFTDKGSQGSDFIPVNSDQSFYFLVNCD